MNQCPMRALAMNELTHAERISVHLEGIASPSDIALLVRRFDLSLRAANKRTSPQARAPVR